MASANVRRWFASLALCVLGMGSCQSASAADGRKLALLVGVDKYAEGSGFRPLPYTERDVEQLAAILIASGYRPEDVRVLTMKRGTEDTRFLPSFRNIRREFDLLAKGRKPVDSLLVALSGHGVKRNDKGSSPGAFFCPLDADITDPTTLISLASFYDMLKESRAGVKVMLVDACQNDPTEGKSGAIPFTPAPPPPSVAALFACSEGEVAWDARDLGGGHGVFFHYVIEGLNGQADTDHNNQVTLAELTAYTQEKVPDYVSIRKSKSQMPYLLWNGGKIALLDLPRTKTPDTMVEAEVNKVNDPQSTKRFKGLLERNERRARSGIVHGSGQESAGPVDEGRQSVVRPVRCPEDIPAPGAEDDRSGHGVPISHHLRAPDLHHDVRTGQARQDRGFTFHRPAIHRTTQRCARAQMKGEADPELFTDEAKKTLVPRLKEGKALFAPYGALKTFQFLEEKATDQGMVFRYRTVFEHQTLITMFFLDKYAKIAGLLLRPAE